jgi:MFS family permease
MKDGQKAEWLAPKQAERGEAPCALFTLPNVAIAMSYFSVGAVMSLQLTPTNLYLVRQLDAAPTAQTTIVILLQVPWALKLVFGFMSDAVPIWGMHRKPYLVFGMFLYSGMYMLYGFAGKDSFQFLCFCVFFATLGLIMMDVMADTMVVERY